MIEARKREVLALATASLVALVYAVPASAASKAWVSNAGVDSGTCGAVSMPCRTLQKAHDNVPTGGDIGVLTPGDCGPLSISKSVNVTNDGAGEAGVLTSGISIAAGAGDVISLRGLIIDGQTGGSVGVYIVSASAVHIQNCVIRNFERQSSGVGLAVSNGGNTQVFVSDTIILNNGSLGENGGILVKPLFGSAEVFLDRVHIENNVLGLKADGSQSGGTGVRVSLRDSIVSGNTSNGVWSITQAGVGTPTIVLVNRSAIVSNGGAGVLAEGGGVLLLSNSTVEYNGTGASTTNVGHLYTYGNNVIDNNAGEDLSAAAVGRALK